MDFEMVNKKSLTLRKDCNIFRDVPYFRFVIPLWYIKMFPLYALNQNNMSCSKTEGVL